MRRWEVNHIKTQTLRALKIAGATLLAAPLLVSLTAVRAQDKAPMNDAAMKQKMAMFTQQNPTKGYLAAHDAAPMPLFGGLLRVHLSQYGNNVLVALPDKRELDSDVFGTPAMPRSTGGAPILEGVSPMLRASQNGKYTQLEQKTPFGSKVTRLDDANLTLIGLDATATDAASTKDRVNMTASWKDKQGNTYMVKCSQVAPHGDAHPVFGGVVTNHLMHGFTNVGTPLMPTEFAYFAFWGKGNIYKNGKLLDSGRMIHGMLTEDVRLPNDDLAFDSQVDPTKLIFHLIVPPMDKNGPSPVKTGFTLPNGEPLPFWHVMFTKVKMSSSHPAK